jgi:hypothetical protein
MSSPTGFLDAAARAFSFLEAQTFSLVSRGEAGIEYESDASRVAVGWDNRSGAVRVLVGLRPAGKEPASWHALSEVLRLSGVFREEPYDGRREDSEESLAKQLRELASDLRSHGQRALAGDKTFFRRLDQLKRLEELVFGDKVRSGRSAFRRPLAGGIVRR